MERVLSYPEGAQLVAELNPTFAPPQRPFMRMAYSDAIKYLEEHDIRKLDGSLYAFGEVGRLLCRAFRRLVMVA